MYKEDEEEEFILSNQTREGDGGSGVVERMVVGLCASIAREHTRHHSQHSWHAQFEQLGRAGDRAVRSRPAPLVHMQVKRCARLASLQPQRDEPAITATLGHRIAQQDDHQRDQHHQHRLQIGMVMLLAIKTVIAMTMMMRLPL